MYVVPGVYVARMDKGLEAGRTIVALALIHLSFSLEAKDTIKHTLWDVSALHPRAAVACCGCGLVYCAVRTFRTTRQATPKRPKRSKAKDQQVHQQESTAGPRAYLPSQLALKTLILAALKELHGEVGGLAHPVDILSWDAVNGEGRLRFPARYARDLLLVSQGTGRRNTPQVFAHAIVAFRTCVVPNHDKNCRVERR